MAKVSIPFLVEKPNKDGTSTFYWQPSATAKAAGWQAAILGKDRARAQSAAIERNAQYDRWKRGELSLPQLRAPVDAGTVNALVARYRREVIKGKKPDGSPRLRPGTAGIYETMLKRIEAWAGPHPLAYVTPARVRKLRDTVARPREAGGLGHAPALNLLKTGRQLFAFAESVDLMPRGSNPFARFDLGSVPPRAQVWELEDDAAFDAAAHELGFPGMALARALALFTAQRQSDLLAFTEHQLAALDIYNADLREKLADQDGKVWGWVFSQGKTSTAYSKRMMQIPLAPELAARVAAAVRHNRARDRAANPPRLTTYVLTHDGTGLPWKARHFIRVFDQIRDHAAQKHQRPGLAELHWHDLRRTRVVRLRRTGMPKEMIGSITGHDPKSIEEMLKVYGPIDPTITAAAIASTLQRKGA